jgi:hypothetical protein
MKIFSCSACKHVTFFENSQCTRCGHTLAYLPDRGALSALERDVDSEPPADGHLRFLALDAAAQGARYRLCQNYVAYSVCNWAIPEHDPHAFCPACRLNAMIPALSDPPDPAVLDSWRGLEVAKRRLVYALLSLGLPLDSKQDRPESGLAFAFKQDTPNDHVLTGHNEGLITINLAEADPASRELIRMRLGERYRTLLGHFRHESGHYYWDLLIKDSELLTGFREAFGNEQEDYEEALKRHYASPQKNWSDRFVSSYATMHPWEDWAETWAHYLHMIDTLETAQSFGIALSPHPIGGAATAKVRTSRMHFDFFAELVEAWVPLTVALNSLNRSMGLPDLYPFVLADGVIAKLRFVHDVIGSAAAGAARTPSAPEVRAAS